MRDFWHATLFGSQQPHADVVLSECQHSEGTFDTYVLSPRGEAGVCTRLADVQIADCDASSESFDTYVNISTQPPRWWLTTNFAERSLMPRHYRCNGTSTCTLNDIRRLLPHYAAMGYSVLNIDWPVEAGERRRI